MIETERLIDLSDFFCYETDKTSFNESDTIRKAKTPWRIERKTQKRAESTRKTCIERQKSVDFVSSKFCSDFGMFVNSWYRYAHPKTIVIPCMIGITGNVAHLKIITKKYKTQVAIAVAQVLVIAPEYL